jgi:2-polyprenyl-3-methyl-5-hydroxy-6-metoxy-1,4-benzoquinol methylase
MTDSARDTDPLSSDQYDAAYYENEGYSRENPVWKPFFGHVADEIIRRYQPRTALDAGCAVGLLVEELRDRGVDARGFDFSDFAINSIPPEVRPYCYVHSITSEIDGQYDFISCVLNPLSRSTSYEMSHSIRMGARRQ